jgi:hypothetical protein
MAGFAQDLLGDGVRLWTRDIDAIGGGVRCFDHSELMEQFRCNGKEKN